MNQTADAEELWKRSRSGARAGRGFRFQDAAATAAAVLCCAGRIGGNAVVPESFDDFTIETTDHAVYVQTKSKASTERGFSAAEIAEILSTPPTSFLTAEPAKATRFVLIDRPFDGLSFENWDQRIGSNLDLARRFKPVVTAILGDEAETDRILSRSGLIAWQSPAELAASVIAERRNVPLGAATGSKLEVLAKVRNEFFSQRGKDFRKELLAAIDDELFGEIVAHIKSFQSTFVFLRSMAGLELGTKLSRLTALSATLDGVASSELASALMIAEDISLDLVRVLVSDLGGPESLMDKHWRETPWALQPTITQGDDGEVEVHADILAVEGELTRKPDSIVFDYAARMLAFFPDAQRITSRPVQVTGLPITINGFSQGVKSFPRRNSSSQATITWNRLLLYAVALRYESESPTDVMQRRKESLEIAAIRLVLHADRRCRGQRLVERGAPATAIHVRDILKQVYGFAILHGEKVANPADDVGPASMANFVPRDRSLSPSEIRVMLKQLEHVATLPTIRLGLRLFLLTMVRKSELQDATWDEVDFENAVWTIPKERMKRSKAHNVYLSRQVLDIFIALKTCSGNSRYVLPSAHISDGRL